MLISVFGLTRCATVGLLAIFLSTGVVRQDNFWVCLFIIMYVASLFCEMYRSFLIVSQCLDVPIAVPHTDHRQPDMYPDRQPTTPRTCQRGLHEKRLSRAYEGFSMTDMAQTWNVPLDRVDQHRW